MALIPVDVGLRLRTQPGETPLASVSPVQEIAADLPQLGQTFTARIQDILPDNTYRALVAGKQVTLSLPQGAQAGDVLELVVVDRTPRLLVARPATPSAASGAEATGGAYPHATFSPAARMIGQLLPEHGQPAAPAPLNAGRPLVSVADTLPTQLADTLAPRLQQAVRDSGLFYEAHQAQWLTGKVTTDQLRAEPQNRLADLPAHRAAAANAGGRDPAPMPNAATADGTAAARTSTEGAAAAQSAAQTSAPPVPEPLRPLVQQQLEAAATQRMAWHGEVWTGQPMEWTVQREARQATTGTESADTWNTRVGMTTPQLGQMDARLSLAGNRLRLTLQAADEASLATLRARLPELESALSAAGLRLEGALVSALPAEVPPSGEPAAASADAAANLAPASSRVDHVA